MTVEYDFGLDEDQDSKKESLNFDSLDEVEHSNNSSSKLVHKGMIISEVVDLYPDVVPLLIENGMHCIGCGASMFETLEEGLMNHGMDDREIDRVVDDLNAHIKQNPKK